MAATGKVWLREDYALPSLPDDSSRGRIRSNPNNSLQKFLPSFPLCIVYQPTMAVLFKNNHANYPITEHLN